MLVVLFSFSAFAQEDCIGWNGLSSDSHPILTQTKHVYLAAEEALSLSVAEAECVDVDTCVWSLSTEVGTLETDVGGSNTYVAPQEIGPCPSQSVEIRLDCTDAGGESFSDQAEVTLACSDDVDDSNPSYWTASGGGCNSPSYAMLFPFLLLFRRKRS